MSTQTTFKTVFRPITKVIGSTLSDSKLDFSGRATNLKFTANQTNTFTELYKAEHLFDGQPVIISNQGSSDLIIGGALMNNGLDYDIEPNTTAVFIYLGTEGKFYDAGGSAYARDIQENLNVTNANLSDLESSFSSHEHDGIDSPKVKVGNLDTQGATQENWVLALDNSGVPFFKNPQTYTQTTARWSNTDTSTNITPSTSWTEVPVLGTEERKDSATIFSKVGNSITVNWTGKIKVKAHVIATSTIQNTQLDIAVKKNNSVRPRISSSYARVISGANEATCFIYDEIDVVPGDTISLVARQGGALGSMKMLSPSSCYLELEIPSSSFAKGDKGDPGYSGWDLYTQAGAPSDALGQDGDVYIDTSNGDFYKKITGSWSLQLNIKGDEGKEGISKSTVWAEKVGTLNNDSEEWSFGAASSAGAGRGITQMVSGKITHLALECRTPGSSSVSVEVLINGVPTGQAITLAASVTKSFVALSSPVNFNVGDIVGFRTVLGGGAANARVSALTAYDGVEIAPAGYVIPTPWKHKVLINSTDVSNGYVDLPHAALSNTLRAYIGRLAIHEAEDFSSTEVNGVTRITFINALAAAGEEAVEAGDELYFHYNY